MSFRQTIEKEISITGVALHAGVSVRMTLLPASDGAGVVFRRTDRSNADICARFDAVAETRLGTVIANGAGVKVGVVEHLMAAIAGAEIDDLIVDLDGPEPPILDGNALSYLNLLDQAGVRKQSSLRRAVEVLKPVTARSGNDTASLSPCADREFSFEIEFPSGAIGRQTLEWRFSPDSFRKEIAPARTFGFVHELDQLRKLGLAGGASLENTLALDGDSVLNAEAMRFSDEFVRHKILDAFGDLALAGGPILGRFEGIRSGHALNNLLLRNLFADSANYRWIDLV